jgi:hypothetical protein
MHVKPLTHAAEHSALGVENYLAGKASRGALRSAKAVLFLQ